MLLLEELERGGCQVEFVDHPMSQNPHDQLLLQIRGAVAEYERSLIAERMRRGRWQKYQAGGLLPWTHPPYGYRVDPARPRDPAGVRLEPGEASVIGGMVACLLQEGLSLLGVTKRLIARRIPTPSGRWRWNQATVRGILANPVYTGTVFLGRYQNTPARHRQSPLVPIGHGSGGHPLADPSKWVAVAQVPSIVSQDHFEQVQARLAHNQQFARRNNTAHTYLLRALVSCGTCQLACTGRSSREGYAYYTCRGKSHAIVSCRDEKCPSRFIPASQLDELVWQDVCEVLTHPESIAQALQRAQGGCWLPQELQARRENLRKARVSLEHQMERLTNAYLANVLQLEEYKRRHAELAQRRQGVAEQVRQLEASVARHDELAAQVQSLEAFCQRVQQGLAEATFEQKRQLIELMIDRVVVTNEEVEIRYVIRTSPTSEHLRFCHLRLDYFNLPAPAISKEHLPCLGFCLHSIIGNQIHHALLHPCFHQIQVFPRTGMAHGGPPQIAGHLLSGQGISDLFLRQILFSQANLPQLLFFSRSRQKQMRFDPADDKTRPILLQDLEPVCRGIAAIKDMDQQPTPVPHTDAQQLFFGVSQFGRKHPFGRPPSRHSQVRKPLHPSNQPSAPLHPHHPDPTMSEPD